MTKAFQATDRTVLRLSGADHRKFLQDLVTNDIDQDGLVYAALLTPQGKYLFDFFLLRDGTDTLLDVASDRAQALAQRLSMYRLRADVQIADSGLSVLIGLGAAPDAGQTDPRHPDLGYRIYTDDPDAAGAALQPLDPADWHAARIRAAVPETGIELLPDDTYILEAGFDRLAGVDFKKGCYVGQEVTARMRHKTELRKGLVRVAIAGDPPTPGTEIQAGGKPAGTLFSTAGAHGLAHLRFDRATGDMTAGDATIRRV